jgi:hypothetical protein
VNGGIAVPAGLRYDLPMKAPHCATQASLKESEVQAWETVNRRKGLLNPTEEQRAETEELTRRANEASGELKRHVDSCLVCRPTKK